MTTLLLHSIAIFIAIYGFSIIFNAPKSELIFCGICGVFSQVGYDVTYFYSGSIYSATIVGIFLSIVFARRLTIVRHMPITVYAAAAVLPVAPGYLIYNSMYSTINSADMSVYYALEAFKIASCICIGMSIGLSLPKGLFTELIKKS